MKIRIKGKFSPIGLVFIGGFLIITILGYVINPGAIYRRGLSYGVRLQLPFSSSGRIVHKTITKKSKTLKSRMFYVSAGEQIVLTRNVNLKEGNFYTSIWKNRFHPPSDVVWSEIVHESTTDMVVIEVEESGFYHFKFGLEKFVGEIDFTWEKVK